MPRTVWYPGHMAKGTRKLNEIVSKLDLIVEVRDSRAPASTSSPLIKYLSKMKLKQFKSFSWADSAKLQE